MATVCTLRFLYCFIGRLHSLGKVSLMPQLAKYIRLHVRTPCKKNQDYMYIHEKTQDDAMPIWIVIIMANDVPPVSSRSSLSE